MKTKRTKKPTDKAEHVYAYDDDKLYFRAKKGAAMKTTFKVTEEGILIPRTNDINLPPNASITWDLTGPAGTAFSTTLTFEGGGGHSHGVGSHDAAAVGRIQPASGTLSGGTDKQTYTAGAVCGRVRDDTVIGNQTFTNYYNIAFPGLVPLEAATGIVLVGSTDTHPTNHYGTPALCNGIRALAAAFHAKWAKPLYVNDMSLPTGGLFDHKATFAPPHATHREGRHVDMNYTSMTDEERTWFKAKGEELGFGVEIHQNPIHWHLRM
jgi:hypothetical protein